jgi:hypothetical protein
LSFPGDLNVKNISQLNPTKRAVADQSIRDCMLAIVVAQGKPVTIPIQDLNEIAANHRLILTVDHKAGLVVLQSEAFAAEIVKEAKPSIILKGQSIGKTA